AMSLPLGAGGRPVIGGEVDLAGVALADARWKLGFEQVRGKARYDQHGFDGNGLSAVRAGRPGTLSLRAGPGPGRGPGPAREAGVAARRGAAELGLAAPQRGGPARRFRGGPRWQVALAARRAPRGAGSGGRLQLRSRLDGPGLDLPEPLSKP